MGRMKFWIMDGEMMKMSKEMLVDQCGEEEDCTNLYYHPSKKSKSVISSNSMISHNKLMTIEDLRNFL